MPDQPLTFRRIFLFWMPLAATWLTMAAEGPFVAAMIAFLIARPPSCRHLLVSALRNDPQDRSLNYASATRFAIDLRWMILDKD